METFGSVFGLFGFIAFVMAASNTSRISRIQRMLRNENHDNRGTVKNMTEILFDMSEKITTIKKNIVRKILLQIWYLL